MSSQPVPLLDPCNRATAGSGNAVCKPFSGLRDRSHREVRAAQPNVQIVRAYAVCRNSTNLPVVAFFAIAYARRAVAAQRENIGAAKQTALDHPIRQYRLAVFGTSVATAACASAYRPSAAKPSPSSYVAPITHATIRSVGTVAEPDAPSRSAALDLPRRPSTSASCDCALGAQACCCRDDWQGLPLSQVRSAHRS